MMRQATVLAALLAAAANAQKFGAKANCTKLADVKPVPDPFTMFTPGKADFHCDMGVPIPFGPVPPGCAKLEVIVARGTSEPGPLGQVVGDPLVARVKRDMKEVSSQGYPVQYPAGKTGYEIGVADIPKRMLAQIKACPDIKFALAGYSQGGVVVQRSISSSLTPELTARVVAVALYGAGNGTLVKGPLKESTIANCARGDFACPGAGEGPGHVSYNDLGSLWHDRSATYIVESFKGKKYGLKTMKSPTDPL